MDSIAACRRILKRSGSSFALAFHILPTERRDAMTAFYAFCREVDDAVDKASDADSARRSLAAWKDRIPLIYEGRATDPVGRALAWSARRFGIRREHLELVLAGVEQDLGVRRYETFAELYEYCYRVASAVGLVCVTVLGETSPEVELYAEMTGIAVQLTNILRDVGEDAGQGRIYLPMEDLRAFGAGEDDLLNHRMTERIKKLLRFEAQRTWQFYNMSEAALPPQSRHRLFFAEALRETYLRLLERLCAEDFPVFSKRISVGKREKLAIALKRRFHPATFLGARQ